MCTQIAKIIKEKENNYRSKSPHWNLEHDTVHELIKELYECVCLCERLERVRVYQ